MYQSYHSTCTFTCVFLSSLLGYQEVDLFSEIRGVNFDNVFGSSEPQKQQQPQQGGPYTSSASPFGGNQNPATGGAPPTMMGGGILTPQAVGPLASQLTTQPQRLTKDVDSSLVRAAENLSMSTSITSSSSYFSSAWPPTTCITTSGNTTSSPLLGSGINITGTSPWTTTAESAGGHQLQQPQAMLGHAAPPPTKSPLDDITIPESLLAGTVGVKTDKVSCGVCMLR